MSTVRNHSLEHNNRGHVCDFTLKYFREKYNCRSLLDIGAGRGLNCAWAQQYHEYEAVGIEADPVLSNPVHDNIIQHDFVKDGVKQFDRTFDLGWSVATSEHIDASGADAYVQTFLACRWIVFTWCNPGYGGYHHVNEQYQSYWLERFQKYGFEYEPALSEIIKRNNQLRMIKSLNKTGKSVRKGYLKDWATVFENPQITE